MKTDIRNSKDLDQLVRLFYSRVQKDKLLGPFFNHFIKDDAAWEKHYQLLVKFWELNLMEKKGFDGNPGKAHNHVDKHFKHTISTAHFDQWVNLWHQTIDELFEGPMAEYAKQRASSMAKGMYKKIIAQRPNGFVLPGNANDLTFG